MIDPITTSNFYLKLKENNENDMAAQVCWTVFYSSRRPSQIGPTADFDGAAIPPPIFSMVLGHKMGIFGHSILLLRRLQEQIPRMSNPWTALT